jgi:hypothetical protein
MLRVYNTYQKQITNQDRLVDREDKIQSILNEFLCTREFLEKYQHYTNSQLVP